MSNNTTRHPWTIDTVDTTGVSTEGFPLRMVRWVSKSASAGDDAELQDENGRTLWISAANASNYVEQSPLMVNARTIKIAQIDSGTLYLYFDVNPTLH